MKPVLLTAFDSVAENYKRVLIISFLFVALQCTVYGQAGTLALTPSPMSPNSASLGKFVEVPVGYYSGTPKISVPLYQFEAKGVSIPLSIDYNASGIKVRDLPGSVGAGWSLNAGGVITRIIRGVPDDHDPQISPPNDYADYHDSLMRLRVRNSHGDFYNSFTEYEKNIILFNQPGCDEEPNMGYSGFRMETEIDMFYFNFMGNTGQFTFTNEGKPMLLSDNDLKIEFIGRKFKITDGKGIQYFFDATEQTYDEGPEVGGRFYNTSWCLSKIYSPITNETITFSYQMYWNSQLYHEDYVGYSIAVDRIRSDGGSDGSYCDPAPNGDHGVYVQYGNAIFIDEINFDNKKVKFYGGLTRTDIFKYKLDSIKVTCDNELVKKIKFDYGYFNNGSTSPLNKKLKLDGLTVSDQVYRFSYFESLHGRGMPSVQSYGQDLWGYYNGEDDHGRGIPNYKVFDRWPDQSALYYVTSIGSTPFNPDYKYAQLGTLQSIQYPTGGKAVFEYEGNDYSKYPFTYDPNYNIETDIHVEFKFESGKINTAGTGTDNPTVYMASQHETSEKYFVLHNDQTVTLRVALGMIGDISYDDYMQYVYDNGWGVSEATANLKRYNEATGEYDIIESFLVHPKDSIGNLDYGAYVSWDGYMMQDKIISLTEGSYKLEVDLWGWFLSGMIQVSSDFPYKKAPGVYNAGGLRIKKIQFIAGTDNKSSFVKTYEYRSDALSSGVLESSFAEFTNSFILSYTNGLLNTCNYIDFTSQAVIPLGNAPGGVIGYSKVTEKREDNSKTVYHFTTGMDELGEYYRDEYSPYRTRITADNSWKRGLSKQTDIYNSNDQLVKQDFSDHSFPYGTLGESSVSVIFEDIYPQISSRAFMSLGYLPTYITKSDRHVLKTRDSTIQYSSAGNIIDVTNYEYSINPYTQLKKQITKTSKGEYLVTNFKYPLDYSVGSSPTDDIAISIKNLQDKHVISPVIEKYMEKKDANGNNTRVVSGQYVKYKSSVPLPDIVFNLETSNGLSNYQVATITGNSSNKDSHYKPSILFDSYDAYGGVTQQSKNADVKEVILWGYKHQYIVAKVIGSTLSTVLSYVDVNILDNPSSESAILTELNKIRTALTGSSAQVYTYAYKPLVGMTASVDPQGRKTSYEFDSAGRLWLIRDQDGNIIKKICYNYSGQPEICN